jgi:predicted NBD/HSP70 family sugar kinase
VGTPGIVDADGTVLSAPNFGWEHVELARILGEVVDVPVIVTNDANAAVLGEFIFESAAQDVLLIRVGRGVGSGLLTGGRVLAGAHLAGGELGHVTVGTDGGPLCACGKVGCLEAWLAAGALRARIASGDANALRDAGERLGIALAPVVGVLDISEILLSGPPELLDGELREATIQTLRARTLTDFHDAVEIRMAGQGDDIVLRGAAVPVLTTQLGVF